MGERETGSGETAMPDPAGERYARYAPPRHTPILYTREEARPERTRQVTPAPDNHASSALRQQQDVQPAEEHAAEEGAHILAARSRRLPRQQRTPTAACLHACPSVPAA